MKTQATTIRQGRSGMVTLVGVTALTLVALGGTALWGLRPGDETATPGTESTTAGVTERIRTEGGLPERYDEMRAAASTVPTAREAATGAPAVPVTDQEMYQARQAGVDRRAAVTLATDMADTLAADGPVTDQEMYQAWQAAARTAAVGGDAR